MENAENAAPKNTLPLTEMQQRKREYQKVRRAALLASGRCVRCGGERVPNEKGGTPNECAACVQKRREAPQNRDVQNLNRWQKERRELRKQAGQCLRCGKKRHANDTSYCLTCRVKVKRNYRAVTQRDRDRRFAASQNAGDASLVSRPAPSGVPLPRLEGKQIIFSVGLDTRTLWALGNLMTRYEREERAAGRIPQPRQTSRLVRETILRWQNKRIPPPINLYGVARRRLTFSLDEPCGRVLRYQADAFFGGNLARAFRALLQTAHAPHRAFTGSSVTSPHIKRF